MPEYLTPGVYVEETSYRAKSIEGVSTSTTGFVGPCRFGPTRGTPILITSFEEFRRQFGGLKPLAFVSGGVDAPPVPNYLAAAVRGYFENGGRRCYVSRIVADVQSGAAGEAQPAQTTIGSLVLNARYPGAGGNGIGVNISGRRSGNVLTDGGAGLEARGLRSGDLVEVIPGQDELAANVAQTPIDQRIDKTRVYRVEVVSGTPWFYRLVPDASDTTAPAPTAPTSGDGGLTVADLISDALQSAPAVVQRLAVDIEIVLDDLRWEISDVVFDPGSDRFLAGLREEDTLDATVPVVAPDSTPDGGTIGDFLENLPATKVLSEGSDGASPVGDDYRGRGDDETATGLRALEEIEEISIVAAPGSSALDKLVADTVRDLLVGHCERMRYRFAVLAGPRNANNSKIRSVRGRLDSKYGALYHPWLHIRNPTGDRDRVLAIPPEGHIAGIYARSDNERGVHKAPANEPIRGILRLESNITRGQQDILNPLGINALRLLEPRGNRVWGARTISSDPEWKYVNIRRLFLFLERSIDVGTQWAVFEPNNEETWLNVRLTVEAFLLTVFRDGALVGARPEEAYFVRCDRTTMTQNDLDNGRLVCLVGVAPATPAEFVIFRIGQWTADASLV